MSRLTLENRRKLVSSILTKPIRTLDRWEYAVSMSWIQSWSNNGHPKVNKSAQTDKLDGAENGEIDLQTEEYSRLTRITMSKDDEENQYLPETIWKMLVSWFGIDINHTLRRRPTYSSYKEMDLYTVGGQCEIIENRMIDHLEIRVGDLNDVIVGKYENFVQVYAWDTLEHISEQTLRCVQRKRPGHRFWFGVKMLEESIDIEPIFDMSDSLMNLIIRLLPRVKQILKDRSQVGDTSGTAKGSQVKRDLAEEILQTFSDHLPQFCIGIEEDAVFETPKLPRPTPNKDDRSSNLETTITVDDWETSLSTLAENSIQSSLENSAMLKEYFLAVSKKIVGDKLDEIGEMRQELLNLKSVLQEREQNIKVRETEIDEKEEELTERIKVFRKGVSDFQEEKKRLMEHINKK